MQIKPTYEELETRIKELEHVNSLTGSAELQEDFEPHTTSYTGIKPTANAWQKVSESHEMEGYNTRYEPDLVRRIAELEAANEKLKFENSTLKKVENKLRESKEIHHLFFKNALVGLIHYNCDGIITEVNDTMAREFGSSSEKLIGLNICNLSNKKFIKEIYKSLDGIPGHFEGEYKSLPSNKTLYIKADWLPIKKGGEVISGVWIVEDITSRKQAEDAIKESEKKYRALFNYAPAGIYEVDFVSNRFLNVNEVMCAYSGYSEEEFLAMNPLDILTEESKVQYLESIEKLFAGGDLPDSIEYNIIGKNGNVICVVLTNDFIYENGFHKGARVVVHDITERKKAEEEKIRAQRIAAEHEKLALVGRIAGSMAHDFNNILGVIMGNTEISLLDCENEKTRTILELIFKQTVRGKNLTKNLVAFAKNQEPKQEFFNINHRIDLVVTLLSSDLNGIKLIKKHTPGLPKLLADPGMIENTLVNLLQNSIHAVSMSESPQIIVKTDCIDDTIRIEVEDNGSGIPEEHFEKIYEPSFTLKGSKDVTAAYKPGIKGTGYGMANVKKYVEQHNGSISFESQQGSGTKFTITLPVIKKELTSQEKLDIRDEISHFYKRILLIEDKSAISDIQKSILTQAPCSHKVDIASSGQQALDLIDTNKYDCISMDYMLSGNINGMDVYHHIRKNNKTLPILFVSGNIDFLESIRELKIKDPLIDHISKPCPNKDYLNSINNLFEKFSHNQP